MKHKTTLTRGQKLQWHYGEVRVMGMAEGYVMVRRKGAMPFVVWEKDLLAFNNELTKGGQSA